MAPKGSQTVAGGQAFAATAAKCRSPRLILPTVPRSEGAREKEIPVGCVFKRTFGAQSISFIIPGAASLSLLTPGYIPRLLRSKRF